MEQAHFIHSANGRLGSGTRTAPGDLDQIVKTFRVDPSNHLILHFHGGLVSEGNAESAADQVFDGYRAGGYPVFHFWESGAFETFYNNLAELRNEDVLKNLLRKAMTYCLRRMSPDAIGAGFVDTALVEIPLEAYWASPESEVVPLKGFTPTVGGAALQAEAETVDSIQFEADLASDERLAHALATLPIERTLTDGVLPAPLVPRRSSLFANAVARELSRPEAGFIGPGLWIRVAWLVARVVRNVLRRFASGRDHGLYATVLEEILREVHVGGSSVNEWGKVLQWERMKKDTEDAFRADASGTITYSGTAFIEKLAASYEDGETMPRVTLVGHSTGAIYIAHWLDKVASVLPDLKVGIVLLAPAIRYDRFVQVIQRHSDRIEQFRMFAMQDRYEREDQLIGQDNILDQHRSAWRFIYPSSLLYLVSGILETRQDGDGAVDDPDAPLLGLHRFFAWHDVYPDAKFPEIATVRQWLGASPDRMIWTPTNGGASGRNSASRDHGGFNTDEATRESVYSILGGW